MVELRYNSSFVSIRSPVLGNTLTVHLRTKIHRAMDNAYWTYKTTPARETLDVSFDYLNRDEIVQVEQFLIASRGQEIIYTDHADRVYRCKVKTDVIAFSHAARRNNQFSLQLEVIPPSYQS